MIDLEGLRTIRRLKPEDYQFPEIDIVFTDGHSSRENPVLIDAMHEKGVHLFKLPAHLTHLYQPLDLVFFSVFKKKLADSVSYVSVQELQIDL